MLDLIENHIEKMLQTYTQGDYFEFLKTAKDKYISLTGKLDEDVSEFESRMSCFNDWYIFQYKDHLGKKLVEDYIKTQKLDADLQEAFLNIRHSLFKFEKTNMKGQIVINDFFQEESFKLSQTQTNIGLVQEDLFIGRSMIYKNEVFLLRGVCILPDAIRPQLVKECKKIRKLNSFEEEMKFLMNLESLKTKSMHYSHIEPSKIFVFN